MSYPLHDAIRNVKSVNEVIRMINESTQINQQDEDGDTPLHVSINLNDWYAFRALIEKGANVWIRNNKKETPFNLINKNEPLWQLYTMIHDRAANPLNRPLFEDSPAEKHSRLCDLASHVITDLQATTIDLIELLSDPDIDINQANANGDTPLHLAAADAEREWISWLMIPFRYTDVNVTDSRGQTPLHIVAGRSGRLDRVELLLKHGALVYLTDNALQTPLHLAAHSKNADIFESLVMSLLQSDGKDMLKSVLESRGVDGNTPLHRAMLGASAADAVNLQRIIQIIIDVVGLEFSGWLMLRMNNDNDTPLHIAARVFFNDSNATMSKVRDATVAYVDTLTDYVSQVKENHWNHDPKLNPPREMLTIVPHGCEYHDSIGLESAAAYKCGVCFAPKHDMCVLSCGHTYCSTCLIGAKTDSDWLSCPSCRNESNVVRLMFQRQVYMCSLCSKDTGGDQYILPCGWVVCEGCRNTCDMHMMDCDGMGVVRKIINAEPPDPDSPQ